MDLIGLLLELVLLVFGVYLYLFSIGKIKAKNPESQQKADKYRLENRTWLRLLSLALVAIMLINVILHIRDILA